jgi:hypothetical protein
MRHRRMSTHVARVHHRSIHWHNNGDRKNTSVRFVRWSIRCPLPMMSSSIFRRLVLQPQCPHNRCTLLSISLRLTVISIQRCILHHMCRSISHMPFFVSENSSHRVVVGVRCHRCGVSYGPKSNNVSVSCAGPRVLALDSVCRAVVVTAAVECCRSAESGNSGRVG